VPSDVPDDELSPRRIRLAARVALPAGEAARLRGALELLVAAEVIDSAVTFAQKLVEGPAARGIELCRGETIECCAGLLEAADAAFSRGEFLGGYALLGISGRLLEELIGAGSTPENGESR
jgi:hypothetical protein